MMTGKRTHLVADALLDIAVGGEHKDAMVERDAPRGGVRVEQATFPARGHRHADRVPYALAERARRGLDARGDTVLGMPGRAAAPLAVGTDVVKGHAIPAEIELQV